MFIHIPWIVALLLLAISSWTLARDCKADRGRPARSQADPWRRRIAWIAWGLLVLPAISAFVLMARGPMTVRTSAASVWAARVYLLGALLGTMCAPFGIGIARWLMVESGVLWLAFLVVLGIAV